VLDKNTDGLSTISLFIIAVILSITVPWGLWYTS